MQHDIGKHDIVDLRGQIAASIDRAIAEQGLSRETLARELGLRRRSLSNIISGSAQSRSTQQMISNRLKRKFWPDIDISEATFPLQAGAIILLENEEAVANFSKQAGQVDQFELSANAIRLTQPAKLTFNLSS